MRLTCEGCWAQSREFPDDGATPEDILDAWCPGAWDGLGRFWAPVCPAHRVRLGEDGEFEFA